MWNLQGEMKMLDKLKSEGLSGCGGNEINGAFKDINRAVCTLWRNGMIDRSDGFSRELYDVLYENLAPVNVLFNYFGGRVILNDECHIIYTEKLNEDCVYSLFRDKPVDKYKTLMLILLANRLYLHSVEDGVATVKRNALYEDFKFYLNDTSDEANFVIRFDNAIRYCIDNRYLKVVPDDDTTYVICDYLRIRVTADKVQALMEQLKDSAENTEEKEDGKVGTV